MNHPGRGEYDRPTVMINTQGRRSQMDDGKSVLDSVKTYQSLIRPRERKDSDSPERKRFDNLMDKLKEIRNKRKRDGS